MEPVEVLNGRGNQVYRRCVPSDTAAEMSQVTDHHDVESVNKAKKMKMDGRKTMVREIKSQVVSI